MFVEHCELLSSLCIIPLARRALQDTIRPFPASSSNLQYVLKIAGFGGWKHNTPHRRGGDL
jgi:hypothetical protein